MSKKMIYLACILVFAFFYWRIKEAFDTPAFILIAISYALLSRLIAEKFGKDKGL